MQELVRGGIELSGQIEYRVHMSLFGNYQLKDRTSELCTEVSHGWPNNQISINTFYQIRTIKLCSQGFFKKVKKGFKKVFKGISKGVKNVVKGIKNVIKKIKLVSTLYI